MLQDLVFEAETDGVRVRVRPCFLEEESRPADHRFMWSYTIDIENRTQRSLQLLSRHWMIADAAGIVHEVNGEGVIGQMPLIDPGESFTYTSGCPLNTPSGLMGGRYRMVDEDGRGFDVRIPHFALLSPYERRPPN